MLAAIAGIALVAGFLLKGPPANPDVAFGPLRVLGVFLVFTAFALSVTGWGRFFCAKLGLRQRGELAMSLALGTAFASWTALILGTVGLISYDFAPLVTLWIVAGALLGSTRPSFPVKLPRFRWSWLPAALFWILFAHWLARSSLANGSTDPFFYHLLGPRDWTDAGRIVFRSGHPATFAASYWEHLLILGNMMLGDHEGLGLIEGHLFGQEVHAGLGFGLTAAILYRMVLRFASWRGWAWLALISMMSSSAFFGLSWLAKNDFGACGWALAGTYLLCIEPEDPRAPRARELFLAGVFLGMAIMAKIVYVMSVGPLLALWTWITLYKGARSGILTVAGGVIVSFTPILLRNWAYTDDPVFPFLHIWLHQPSDWLGPTLAAIQAQMTAWPAGSLAFSLRAFWRLLLGASVLAPASVLLFLWASFAPRLRGALLPLTAALLALAYYSSVRFVESFDRWVGQGLLIVAAFGVLALAEGAEALAGFLPGNRERSRRVLGTLVALGLVLVLRPDRLLGPDVWSRLASTSPTLAIREPGVLQGGDSLAWLRLNAKPEERIVTTGYQLTYYVSALDVTAIVNDPALDAAVSNNPDLVTVVKRLRASGVRYVLDVAKWDSRYYWPIGWVMDDAVSAHPEVLRYHGPDSFVLDLPRLSDELEQACTSGA